MAGDACEGGLTDDGDDEDRDEWDYREVVSTLWGGGARSWCKLKSNMSAVWIWWTKSLL
ncbi:hypothetical protein SESBI_19808 [Sesbania bispinosa]|nr:hypothetical protein SESBI_19808 [Sesbania bispinosa]